VPTGGVTLEGAAVATWPSRPSKGKLRQIVSTAIARELAGFVWSIACITTGRPAKSVSATMVPEDVCPVSVDCSRADRQVRKPVGVGQATLPQWPTRA
jgi:hypothetical protein